MAITKDYYFVPDKRRFKIKEAMDLVFDFVDYTQISWQNDRENMKDQLDRLGMCVNTSEERYIFQAVQTTDQKNQKIVSFMLSHEFTIPSNIMKIDFEAKNVTKVMMMEDYIHVSKTVGAETGRVWDDVIEIPEEEKDFIRFLSKKRLTGKTANFQNSTKPVYLRLDDAPAILKLLKGDSRDTVIRPIMILHTDDYNLINEVSQNFNPTFQIMVLNDEELIEELLDTCTDGETEKVLNTILEEESYTLLSEFNICVRSKQKDETKEDFCKAMMSTVATMGENYTIFNTNDCIAFETMLTSKIIEALELIKDEREEYKHKMETLKSSMMAVKKGNKSQAGSPCNITVPVPTIGNGKYLKAGKEKELYQGEIYDMIIDSLQEYRSKYVQDGTRRADVLDSILAENKTTGTLDKKYEELDRYFKNYQGNTPKALKDAEKIGFKVKSKSNHLKLEWCGDPRYAITISSSPSEYLTGENAAALSKRTCL